MCKLMMLLIIMLLFVNFIYGCTYKYKTLVDVDPEKVKDIDPEEVMNKEVIIKEVVLMSRFYDQRSIGSSAGSTDGDDIVSA